MGLTEIDNLAVGHDLNESSSVHLPDQAELALPIGPTPDIIAIIGLARCSWTAQTEDAPNSLGRAHQGMRHEVVHVDAPALIGALLLARPREAIGARGELANRVERGGTPVEEAAWGTHIIDGIGDTHHEVHVYCSARVHRLRGQRVREVVEHGLAMVLEDDEPGCEGQERRQQQSLDHGGEKGASSFEQPDNQHIYERIRYHQGI